MNKRSLFVILMLILVCQIVKSKSIKGNARPVHETINEQSRADLDKSRATHLPYGNPLAGNSQIARQHALHQQAMFNAERNRQHRAQLQRWTTAPQKMDSYMKAYHESQENHHLALETQQSKLKDSAKDLRSNKPVTVTAAPQTKKIVHVERPERSRVDASRITKADAVRVKQDKNRNHRSYGSDYYAHLPKYNLHHYPVRTYEGVTIKPNGNNGLSEGIASSNDAQSTSLYTEAVPSKTQYVYPKQYSQMQAYQSAQDIASLNSLLKRPAHDQLSELQTLVQSSKQTDEDDATNIHKPIDLFFYLKDVPSKQSIAKPYDESKFVLPQTYAQEYANEQVETPKDHTPITEEVDDIADPNMSNKLTTYGIQPVLAPQPQILQEIQPETKSNNYYKVEVASQTISAGYKPTYHSQIKQPVQYVLQEQEAQSEDEHKPEYQSSHYGQQPLYYYKDKDETSGDVSERYVHHNAQHKGIQHLTEDGTGISAYGDSSENVSKNKKSRIKIKNKNTTNNTKETVNIRQRRSLNSLDTNPFIVPEDKASFTTSTPTTPTINIETEILNDTVHAESLIRVNHFHPQINDFDMDNINEYDDYVDSTPLSTKFKPPFRPDINKFESFYEDDDESNDFDEFETDYDSIAPTPLYPRQQYTYAPSIGYQNADLLGSYSNKQHKRRPVYGTPSYSTYTSPNLDSFSHIPASYGTPHATYGVPLKIGGHNLENILEPVYMLTESQLKNIIGHHNLNIGHLDVYQVSKQKRPPKRRYPRRYKKRSPYRNRRKLNKKLRKLNKFLF